MFLSINTNSKIDLVLRAAADLILSEMKDVSKAPVVLNHTDLQRCLVEAVLSIAKKDAYLQTMVVSNPELLFAEFRANYLLEGGACHLAEIGTGDLLVIPVKKFDEVSAADIFEGAATLYSEYKVEESESESDEVEEVEEEEDFEEEEDDEDEDEDEDEDDEDDEDEDDEDEDDEDEDEDDEDEDEEEDDFSDLDALDGIDELFGDEEEDEEEDEKPAIKKSKASKSTKSKSSKVARRNAAPAKANASKAKPTKAKPTKTKANRINRRK